MKAELDRRALRRVSVVFFWLVLIALAGLFFTNDFGIVDLHKTSIITAVGVDVTENEVQVTAQLAVPMPSQSGENVEYTAVQGSGETIADALNEINVKTGFYPQLQFCKLILLGDSCKEKNIFQVLGCFYRKNYSELTAKVAMCEGKASDMLSMKTSTSDMTASVILRALSDELKKSANVSGVNLKDIAVENFSVSSAAYMPYVEANKSGTSEEGGNGDNVGGDPPSGGGGSSEGGSGGGSSGGGSSGGGGQESGGGGGSAPGGDVEFTARKTACFSGGEFKGILDEQQSFALDILKNEIRLAVLPCDAGEYHYTLGLKNVKSKTELKIKDGKPLVTVKFGARAQIAGIKKPVDPAETAADDKLTGEVKEGADREMEARLSSLVEACRKSDCDILGIKTLLYKYHNSHYGRLKDSILSDMEVVYDVEINSVN